jgi:hypothetical protein
MLLTMTGWPESIPDNKLLITCFSRIVFHAFKRAEIWHDFSRPAYTSKTLFAMPWHFPLAWSCFPPYPKHSLFSIAPPSAFLYHYSFLLFSSIIHPPTVLFSRMTTLKHEQ